MLSSKAYLGMFDQLGQENKGSTEWKTSCLEKQGKALFIRSSVPLTPLAGPTQGEICHIVRKMKTRSPRSESKTC